MSLQPVLTDRVKEDVEMRSQPLVRGRVQNQTQPAPDPRTGRSDGGRARMARLVSKTITHERPLRQKISSSGAARSLATCWIVTSPPVESNLALQCRTRNGPGSPRIPA